MTGVQTCALPIYLTHLTLHAERETSLPAGVRLAYDGLQLDL